MPRGHAWTYDEDYTCCELYLKFAKDTAAYKSIDELIHRIKKELPQIKEGSIRMKIQNIKYLSKTEAEARRLFPNGDGVPISPLWQASEQNRRAFLHALKNIGVTPPPPPPPPEPPIPPEPPTPIPRIQFGDTVRHKSFGIGTVVSINQTGIRVRFGENEKSFLFPDAFNNGFLTVIDDEKPAPEKPAGHAWTYEEEFILCRLYLDHRYGFLSKMTDDEFIAEAVGNLPGVSVENVKDGLEFIDALMEREDEEIDEDDPDDELVLKKALAHALKDFVKTELEDKRKSKES